MNENKKPVTSYKTWKRICLICIFLTLSAFLGYAIYFYNLNKDFSAWIQNNGGFFLPMLPIGLVMLFSGKVRSARGRVLLSVLFALCFIVEIYTHRGILLTMLSTFPFSLIGVFFALDYLVIAVSFMKYITMKHESKANHPFLSGLLFFVILVVLCALAALVVNYMMAR